MSSRDLIHGALFAALTVVGALLSFHLPFLTPVPFTLQVLAVLLAGLLLGPAGGAVSQGLYLFLGLVGIPVFAGLAGGPGVIFGPTGGYLLSYPAAAAVAGLGRGRGRAGLILAALAGLLVIYAGGFLGLIALGHLSPEKAFLGGVAPFLPYDLAKALLAVAVALRLVEGKAA